MIRQYRSQATAMFKAMHTRRDKNADRNTRIRALATLMETALHGPPQLSRRCIDFLAIHENTTIVDPRCHAAKVIGE